MEQQTIEIKLVVDNILYQVIYNASDVSGLSFNELMERAIKEYFALD